MDAIILLRNNITEPVLNVKREGIDYPLVVPWTEQTKLLSQYYCLKHSTRLNLLNLYLVFLRSWIYLDRLDSLHEVDCQLQHHWLFLSILVAFCVCGGIVGNSLYCYWPKNISTQPSSFSHFPRKFPIGLNHLNVLSPSLWRKIFRRCFGKHL